MNKITFDKDGFANEDRFINAYSTDGQGVYLGMQQIQINKGFGLPMLAYLDAPMVAVKANEVIVRDDNTWVVAPDFRGQVFYKKESGESITINKVGVITEDLTNKEKPDQFYVWNIKKNDWILDKTLKQDFITAQNTDQKVMLRLDAEARITLLERKAKLGRATSEDVAMLDLLYGFTLDLDVLDMTKENIVFPEFPI